MTCKLCDICGDKITHERRIAFSDIFHYIGECDVCSSCMAKILCYLLDISNEDEQTVYKLKKRMEAFK